MAIDYTNTSTQTRRSGYDFDLRKYLMSVYKYMAFALGA